MKNRFQIPLLICLFISSCSSASHHKIESINQEYCDTTLPTIIQKYHDLCVEKRSNLPLQYLEYCNELEQEIRQAIKEDLDDQDCRQPKRSRPTQSAPISIITKLNHQDLYE